MTHAQFNKLIKNLRKGDVTKAEAETCADIIDSFVDMCDELQNDGNLNCGDIFGTEGWEHRVGID